MLCWTANNLLGAELKRGAAGSVLVRLSAPKRHFLPLGSPLARLWSKLEGVCFVCGGRPNRGDPTKEGSWGELVFNAASSSPRSELQSMASPLIFAYFLACFRLSYLLQKLS
jgi:hypothetical protein